MTPGCTRLVRVRLSVVPLVLLCVLLLVPRPARASGDPVGYIVALLVHLIVEGVDRYGDDIATAASLGAEALIRAEAGLPPIARGAIHNVRRSIALGPRGGVAASYTPSAARGEAAFFVGLALEVFRGPIVPGAEELRALLVDGLRARIVAVARDLSARGGPPPDEAALRRYAEEILAATHSDVSSRMETPHRWFPPPLFGVAADIAGRTGSKGLELRLTGGFGIGPVSVGPTAAFRADQNEPAVLLGAEVSGHLITSKGLRTPVIDLFLRADFAVRENSTTSHQGVVGLRLLLDLL